MSIELVRTLQAQWQAQLVETHISWVLLDGRFAWKIKKPMRLPFLDFSDLGTRQRLCETELQLNRRLAPDLYLSVVPIAGTPAAPVVNGPGTPFEYALKMKQFEPGALLSERLAAGALDADLLARLAERLADFHASAAVAPSDTIMTGCPSRATSATCDAAVGPLVHGPSSAPASSPTPATKT